MAEFIVEGVIHPVGKSRITLLFVLILTLLLALPAVFMTRAAAWDIPAWEIPTWNIPEWKLEDLETEQREPDEEQLDEWDKHEKDQTEMSEEPSEKAEKKKDTIWDTIGKGLLDAVDFVTKKKKDITNSIVDFSVDKAGKLADYQRHKLDRFLQGANSSSFGLLKGVEKARYAIVDRILGSGTLEKLGMPKAGSSALRAMHNDFHQLTARSLETVKSQISKSINSSTRFTFGGIQYYQKKLGQGIKSFLEKKYDKQDVKIKSKINAIFHSVDLRPSHRPHGTLEDVKIEDGDLMKMARFSYYENDSRYEKSGKGEIPPLDEQLPGFIEMEEDSVSGVSGFSAKTFYHAETNTVVVAFRGTEPDYDMLRDFTADGQLVFGSSVKQTSEANDLLRKVINKYPDAQLALTGESLGGYIAQQMGRQHKIPTIAFNGPGAQVLPLGGKDNNYAPLIAMHNARGKYDDLVINHIHEKDGIGNIGIHTGKTVIYPKDGEKGYTVKEHWRGLNPKHWQPVKVGKALADIFNGTPCHLVENFEVYLKEGNLQWDGD